jgi:hypothetical protein
VSGNSHLPIAGDNSPALSARVRIRRTLGARINFLRDAEIVRQIDPLVIGVEHAVRKGERLVRNLLVRCLLQEMADAIEPGSFLVIALDDPPRRFRDARAQDHLLLRFRVRLPSRARLQTPIA